MDKLIISQSKKALSVELLKLGIPFVFCLIIIIVLITGLLSTLFSDPLVFTLVTLFFTLGSVILFLAIVGLKKYWQTKRYEFYDNNVHVLTGVLGSSHVSYGLSSVTSVKINQTIVGNHLNYGTITLNFFGGNSLNLENISQPEEKLVQIQSFIDRAKS